MDFNFIASNNFDLKVLGDVEKFVETFPDFQAVSLNDENELKLLLKLMGITEFKVYDLIDSDFSKYYDLSASNLPELDDTKFDEFYTNWLRISQRDNNMDEFGNLIFLRGLSSKWNKMSYRFVVKE